ncbi:MAG: hypothetical protein M5U15_14575 [Kiritimatiellae bacterium]|nr:hypothetical protein [Kiritimatiellia bacterium]
MDSYIILRWVHILSMIGLLGGLLVYQFGLSTPTRMDAADLRGSTRFWNILITIGLASGIWLYLRARGYEMRGHFNGIIAMKFIILIIVGGLLAAARKNPARGDVIRWWCILLLLIASFSAFTLSL